MDTFVLAENSRKSTQELADEWHTSRDSVREWCKAGYIPGARKDRRGNTAWSIPTDARRPIDSVLIREVLWQILESKDSIPSDLDFTDWGISLHAIPELIQILSSSGYLKPLVKDRLPSLTRKGYSILGRYGRSAENASLPVPLQWLSTAGGTFVGSAVKQLIEP